MDLDKEFVKSVIRGGLPAYAYAQERGVSDVLLEGDGAAAWKYVVEHRKQYGSIPSYEVVFQRTKVDLPDLPTESHQFWIDELINRRTYQTLKGGAAAVAEKLEDRDPKAAAEIWVEINRKLREEHLTYSRVESLLALGTKVLEQYDNAKLGIKGIPTPWPTMTNQTMGWWPEDLVLFVGRLATGKTWTLILTTHCAWMAKKRCLIVSTEMNKIRMAMRFFALHFRLGYDDLRKGKLGEFVEQKLRQGIADLLKEQGLWIVGGNFDFSMENVEAAVDECEPDLTAIDGPYLIKNAGKDRHERVSNTFDDCKRMSKRRQMVTIANSQFNRQAKKGEASTIAAENIGITDVAGWNMDVGYGLQQSDNMRDDSKMGFRVIKIREGKPKDFISRWDLDRMEFYELNEDGSQMSDGSEVASSGFLDLGGPPERVPGSDDGESDDFSDLPSDDGGTPF